MIQKRNRNQLFLVFLSFCLIILFVFNTSSEDVYRRHDVNITNLIERTLYTGVSHCNEAKFLIAVPTSPLHYDERQAFRTIYPNIPHTWNLIFFVGSADDDLTNTAISEESSQNNDMVLMDFQDSYRNLTLKSLLILKWTRERCPTATFLLKMDDDVFLNVSNLEKLVSCLTHSISLNHTQTTLKQCHKWPTSDTMGYFKPTLQTVAQPYVAGGYVYASTVPNRNPLSKWYLDEQEFPNNTLPTHLSGTAYLITTNLIPFILSRIPMVPFVTLEDLYITGIILSQSMRLRLSNLEGWNNFRPIVDDLCIYKESVVIHGLYPHEFEPLLNAVEQQTDCQGFRQWKTSFIRSLSYYFPKVKM